jgi:type I restriction enzyme S subunit
MGKLKNIPSLRFPEFKREWNINKLAEVAEKRIVKNKDNKIKNVFTNSAIHGIINQRDFFDKDIANQNNLLGYFIVEHNDFIYNPRISTHAPVGPISRNKLQSGIMSPLYSVFRFNEAFVDFVEHFFNTTKWHKHMEDIANYGARDDRMSFSVADFYKMPIPLPDIEEQKKIASFLTVVDDKIQALKQKKTLLEQYKKGVMQKIFSQELRFKDDNGNDYPDWEEKKLGDCLDYIQPTKYLVSSKEYDNSYMTPVLTAGKTFILGYTNETNGIFENNLPVIIFDDFTTATKFVDFPFKAKSSAMKILISNEGINIKFIFEAMEVMNYEVGGHERHWISKFAPLDIGVPSYEEQTKIANFLSVIDDKINHCQSQIEKTEVWKKGLLQQMFC